MVYDNDRQMWTMRVKKNGLIWWTAIIILEMFNYDFVSIFV